MVKDEDGLKVVKLSLFPSCVLQVGSLVLCCSPLIKTIFMCDCPKGSYGPNLEIPVYKDVGWSFYTPAT